MKNILTLIERAQSLLKDSQFNDEIDQKDIYAFEYILVAMGEMSTQILNEMEEHIKNNSKIIEKLNKKNIAIDSKVLGDDSKFNRSFRTAVYQCPLGNSLRILINIRSDLIHQAHRISSSEHALTKAAIDEIKYIQKLMDGLHTYFSKDITDNKKVIDFFKEPSKLHKKLKHLADLQRELKKIDKKGRKRVKRKKQEEDCDSLHATLVKHTESIIVELKNIELFSMHIDHVNNQHACAMTIVYLASRADILRKKIDSAEIGKLDNDCLSKHKEMLNKFYFVRKPFAHFQNTSTKEHIQSAVNKLLSYKNEAAELNKEIESSSPLKKSKIMRQPAGATAPSHIRFDDDGNPEIVEEPKSKKSRRNTIKAAKMSLPLTTSLPEEVRHETSEEDSDGPPIGQSARGVERMTLRAKEKNTSQKRKRLEGIREEAETAEPTSKASTILPSIGEILQKSGPVFRRAPSSAAISSSAEKHSEEKSAALPVAAATKKTVKKPLIGLSSSAKSHSSLRDKPAEKKANSSEKSRKRHHI